MRAERAARLAVVGAAIVRDGRCLVARRGPGSQEGRWELPGGKVEAGESASEALRREIREELAVEIEVGRRIGRGVAGVDGRQIELDVYAARLVEGELTAHEHAELRWVAIGDLDALEWAAADVPVLPQLRALLVEEAKG